MVQVFRDGDRVEIVETLPDGTERRTYGTVPLTENSNPNHDEKGRFTSSEIRALEGWTGPESDFLRAMDRGEAPSSSMHQALHSALGKIEHFHGEVHRGLYNVDVDKLPKAGDTYTLPDTQSASASPRIARAYAMRERTVDDKQWHDYSGAVIHAKTATAADLRPHQVLSYLKHESEIALRKGTSYRVVRTEDEHARRKDNDSKEYGGARLIRHVYMEEIPTANEEARDYHGRWTATVVGKEEHERSQAVEKEVAHATGCRWESDNKPFDAEKQGHAVEIKSLLKGSKQSISVHEDALLRKVKHAEETGRVFHTVAVDERATYQGGSHSENYSGHRMYYKRGCGRYSLSQMQPVKSAAELKRLMAMPHDMLPERAKGSLPTGQAVKQLAAKAEQAHASRLRKDRARKARLKEQQ